jgi:hypothetical protein
MESDVDPALLVYLGALVLGVDAELKVGGVDAELKVRGL